GAAELAGDVDDDAAQPAAQLLLGFAAEALARLVGREQGGLDDVAGAGAPADVAGQVLPGHETEGSVDGGGFLGGGREGRFLAEAVVGHATISNKRSTQATCPATWPDRCPYSTSSNRGSRRVSPSDVSIRTNQATERQSARQAPGRFFVNVRG